MLFRSIKEIDKYVGQQLVKDMNKRQSYKPNRKGADFTFYINYAENKYLCKSSGGEVSIQNGKTLDTWVRWGWFEDNVLSKFLTIAADKKDKASITEFQSKEEKYDDDGKKTGELESVRIRNHKDLETVNINNYILPGKLKTFNPEDYKTIDLTEEGFDKIKLRVKSYFNSIPTSQVNMNGIKS